MLRWAALLFLLALVPRLIGLGWALPDRSRYYSYHPDEPVLLAAIKQVRFADLQLSPRFFNYGSLYLYLCRATIDVATVVGWIDSRWDDDRTRPPMERWVESFARIHWLGRLVAALLGALTAVVTYAVGRRLYGEIAGRVAGTFMAIAPLHLVHSHFLAVDVPATFWVAAALWSAVGSLEKPARGRWLLTGLLTGFAAGTKYNTGLVLLAAVAGLAFTVRRAAPERRRDAALDGGVYLFLGVALGFLIATPGVIIDSKRFRGDLDFERRHMGEGHDLVFINTAPGWIYHITHSLAGGIGWPATLLCLAGAGWALWRRREADWLLLAYALPYYLLLGSFQVKFARYMLPLYPVFALWIGRLWVEAGASRDRETANRRIGESAEPEATVSPPRPLAPSPPRSLAPSLPWPVIVVGAALLWTALYALALEVTLVTPDSRTLAARWLGSVAKERRAAGVADRPSVGLLRPPWFYTPPLSPGIGCVKHLQVHRFCSPDRPPHLRLIEPPELAGALSPQVLLETRPEYVVINEFEYTDALRLAGNGGPRTEIAELWEKLGQNYSETEVFVHRPRLGPLAWFARSTPPHDLLYIMPTTRIWVRRDLAPIPRSESVPSAECRVPSGEKGVP